VSQQATEDSERCPECGSTNLVHDGENGEVVCCKCGLVMGGVEYAAPFRGGTMRGSFALTGLATGKPAPSEVLKLNPDGARMARMIGRLEGNERTLATLANAINGLAGRIGLPKTVEEEAMAYGKRFLRAMREKRRRLTITEVAVVSIWYAMKVQDYPMTMKEYARYANVLLARNGRRTSLYKLIAKAAEIVPPPDKMFTAADYVNRFAARLKREPDFVSTVAICARELCRMAEDELLGKDPACAAVTALCVADEMLGPWMGAERMREVLGVGYSQSTAQLLKKVIRKKGWLPPPVIHDTVLDLIERKAMETVAEEDVKLEEGGEKA